MEVDQAADVRVLLRRVHGAIDDDAGVVEWKRLASDLAYWCAGRSYAEVDVVASSLGTALAELPEDDQASDVGLVLSTATVMLGALSSAAMRRESDDVVERSDRSVTERVRDQLSRGAYRPSELAELVDADRFQVSKAIRRLLEQGEVELVSSDAVDGDGRARRYRVREPLPRTGDPTEFARCRSRAADDGDSLITWALHGPAAFEPSAVQAYLSKVSGHGSHWFLFHSGFAPSPATPRSSTADVELEDVERQYEAALAALCDA